MKNLKRVQITALITGMIILSLVLLLRIFDALLFIFLFYAPVIFVTWEIVLICVKKFRIEKATLPGIWMFVLGLVMLAVGIPAWFILGTIETDLGYSFVISITVIAPGIFVASIGFVLLLIGIAFNLILKQRE